MSDVNHVRRSCIKISQKIGLRNKKIRIYQTIKGLIILVSFLFV